jgi:hypothetical protein
VQLGSDVPPEEPPAIRPSTAAGRAERPPRRPPRRSVPAAEDWEDPEQEDGGLFDDAYDPRSRPRGAGGPGGRSVRLDPDDLDDEPTAPQPLRRVRRTGAPVPPRGQPATQVRSRAATSRSEDEGPDDDASRTRYLVVAVVLVVILLALLGILAL